MADSPDDPQPAALESQRSHTHKSPSVALRGCVTVWGLDAVRQWQWQWVVLSSHNLLFFETNVDVSPLITIDTQTLVAVPVLLQPNVRAILLRKTTINTDNVPRASSGVLFDVELAADSDVLVCAADAHDAWAKQLMLSMGGSSKFEDSLLGALGMLTPTKQSATKVKVSNDRRRISLDARHLDPRRLEAVSNEVVSNEAVSNELLWDVHISSKTLSATIRLDGDTDLANGAKEAMGSKEAMMLVSIDTFAVHVHSWNGSTTVELTVQAVHASAASLGNGDQERYLIADSLERASDKQLISIVYMQQVLRRRVILVITHLVSCHIGYNSFGVVSY